MYKGNQEFLKKRYDPVNNRTILRRQENVRLKPILSLLNETKAPISLLDIGCYNGYISILLKKRLGKKCEVYGVDIAENTIALAKKRGVKANLCDITKGINFKDNMFDYVFAGEIIEHLQDTDFFLQEIKRVLKQNGTLILTTPNFLSFGRRIYYLFGIGIYMEASFNLPKNAAGHIRYYTFDTLKQLLAYHEFEEMKTLSDAVTFPGFESSSLAKIFPTFGRSIIVFTRNKK